MSNIETMPFHKIRVQRDLVRKDTGELYDMGFIDLKPEGGRLKDKVAFVTFDNDVIEELQGAGRGDIVEYEVAPPKEKGQDPVITDAELVQ